MNRTAAVCSQRSTRARGATFVNNVPVIVSMPGQPARSARTVIEFGSYRMRTALTIAGSDSGGGAGIQADLKTFAAHRVYGTSALTAVTAQNTRGVLSWQALPPALVRAQIEAVVTDIGADAVKIGMLADAAIVAEVAAAIRQWKLPNVVLD